MICNTAVFYDVENLISLFHGKGNKTLQLDEIYNRITNLDVVSGISIQKAYADWALQINRNLRSYVLQIGIEPVQIFNTNQNDKIKNAADVSLIIDAVELISRRPEIENYVIASGDGIFAFLARKLHEYGKKVIGCGFDRNTNIVFKNACDVFIALEKSDNSLTAVVKNFNKGTILSLPPAETETPPPPLPSQEVKIPNKLPKIKFSETLVLNNISVFKNAKDHSGSLHLIKRMVNLLFESSQEDSDLEISVLKVYVEHYLPGFRIGQYGFKRFGEFMRFVVSASPYCLFLCEGTVVRIARRDAVRKVNDVLMEDLPHLLFTLNDGGTVKSLFDIEDGVPFTYAIDSRIKTPAVKQENTTKTENDENTNTEDDKSADASHGSDSVRKWIKDSFKSLSKEGRLTANEVKQLSTKEYSQKAFGVKTPILKELRARGRLQEQRMEDGKIKYWKEEFVFNGKPYLIFKEWTAKLHRTKFTAWLNEIEKAV